jgi:hypothetical protein
MVLYLFQPREAVGEYGLLIDIDSASPIQYLQNDYFPNNLTDKLRCDLRQAVRVLFCRFCEGVDDCGEFLIGLLRDELFPVAVVDFYDFVACLSGVSSSDVVDAFEEPLVLNGCVFLGEDP